MLMNDANTRQDETLGIVQVAILILTLIILCAMMADTVFVLPRQVSRMIAVVDTFVNIKTAEDAVWWSVSTMTLVGYGDKYPVTTEGRIIGMILMFAGVGMFGGLSGLVASFFLGAHERKSVDPKEILIRLDRLQATVNTLKPERAEGPPQDKSG